MKDLQAVRANLMSWLPRAGDAELAELCSLLAIELAHRELPGTTTLTSAASTLREREHVNALTAAEERWPRPATSR